MPVFVIAPLVLNPADRDRVAELRNGYDPQARYVEPHVTLVFAVDDGLEANAVEWARICVAKTDACALRLTWATVARNYENSAWYLFLLPKQIPPALADLKARLNGGPLSSAPDVAFDAHVSVGRFQEKVLADSVARDLNAMRLGIEARIGSLAVIRFDGKEVCGRTAVPLRSPEKGAAARGDGPPFLERS